MAGGQVAHVAEGRGVRLVADAWGVVVLSDTECFLVPWARVKRVDVDRVELKQFTLPDGDPPPASKMRRTGGK